MDHMQLSETPLLLTDATAEYRDLVLHQLGFLQWVHTNSPPLTEINYKNVQLQIHVPHVLTNKPD